MSHPLNQAFLASARVFTQLQKEQIVATNID